MTVMTPAHDALLARMQVLIAKLRAEADAARDPVRVQTLRAITDAIASEIAGQERPL